MGQSDWLTARLSTDATRACHTAANAVPADLQAQSLNAYLKAIRVTLEAALSIRNFASQVVERHNKPEVEARSDNRQQQQQSRQ